MTILKNLELRTKPTVEAGLVLNVSSPQIQFVEYQPGNGTRYFMSIVSTGLFPNEVNGRLGFGDDPGYIITDLISRVSMFLVSNGSFLSARYIKEKLGCTTSDAYVLAEMLGELLGRDYEKAGP